MNRRNKSYMLIAVGGILIGAGLIAIPFIFSMDQIESILKRRKQ